MPGPSITRAPRVQPPVNASTAAARATKAPPVPPIALRTGACRWVVGCILGSAGGRRTGAISDGALIRAANVAVRRVRAASHRRHGTPTESEMVLQSVTASVDTSSMQSGRPVPGVGWRAGSETGIVIA